MILYDKGKMNDVSAVGGKAIGLAKLVNYGCSVPDFFVITAGTVLDDDFAAELIGFAAILHCETFSVRSSNVHEDRMSNSFAGQYLTLLNVAKDNLFRAVKNVADSVNANRAQQYAGHFSTCPSDMAIIVQAQIDGVRSGVLFTQSFASADEMLIESVDGAGELLVGGTVTPQKKIICKDNPQTDFEYESELVAKSMLLERQEGFPLDIEWTYSDKLYFLQMRPMTVVGDALPDIPKRNWQFYVYRDFCTLVHSVQRRASESDLQERIFGFSVPIYEGLLVNGREFYSEENDAATNKIWASLDNGIFFEKFTSDIEALVRRTKRRVNHLKKMSFRDYDNARLLSAYRKEIECYIDSYAPLMMRPDDYLVSEIEKIAPFSAETADILTPVWKKTFYSEEKIDFLKARISGSADAYVEKYEWIGNPLGRTVTRLRKEDVEKRFDRITSAQADSRLKQLTASKARKRKRFDNYLDEHKDAGLNRLLRLISRFIYLRTYTAENSDRLFYYIRKKILSEIAARFNIPIEEILCMNYDEVAELKDCRRVDRTTIAKRKSGELITFFGGESRAYYGGAVSALLKKLTPYDEKMRDGILCGDVACAGEVSGRVKIVRNFSETEKVNDGDIVVTSMTTPEIVCALEKAGGIITDEGGVTCHAAILAREYGTPCLVGTKCATSVLTDGEKVYLDCVTGQVKILPDED
ncbi:MAG: hypothetical protein J1G04_04660 [Clostridiales bacterium]|nr:hypothetical protein [Clostridiales bacterium]